MMMMMRGWDGCNDGDWVLVMTVSEPGTGTTTSGHASPNGRNPLDSIRRWRSAGKDPHILEDGLRLVGRRDDGEKEERKEQEISLSNLSYGLMERPWLYTILYLTSGTRSLCRCLQLCFSVFVKTVVIFFLNIHTSDPKHEFYDQWTADSASGITFLLCENTFVPSLVFDLLLTFQIVLREFRIFNPDEQ